jgi:8-oxo-dGTP diphosphatase
VNKYFFLGQWALPGGHLERFEQLHECAIREVKEETGLDINNVRFATVDNTIDKADNYHYVGNFICSI